MISRKLFAIIAVAGILTLGIIPMAQAAGGDLTGESVKDYCELHYPANVPDHGTISAGQRMGPGITQDWGLYCMMDSIKWITNLIFNFIMIISVLAILAGAAVYATAGGREDQLGTAKGILTGAVIGLVIAVLAKLIPSVVRGVVGL